MFLLETLSTPNNRPVSNTGSPSPGRKLSSENELSSAQRRDTERQQILQRLVGTHVRRPSKLTAESVLLTSLTTEGRAFIGRHPATADEQSTDTDTMAETVLEMSANSQLDLKAEKRVHFYVEMFLSYVNIHVMYNSLTSEGFVAA